MTLKKIDHERAPWAPKKIRHLFVGSGLASRCENNHAPRLVWIDGEAWIGACARGPLHVACPGAYSLGTLFRLGRRSELPAIALKLESFSLARKAWEETVPIPDIVDLHVACRSEDVTIAELLGADTWRCFFLGERPGVVALNGERALALLAVNAMVGEAFVRAVRP